MHTQNTEIGWVQLKVHQIIGLDQSEMALITHNGDASQKWDKRE